MRITKEQLAQVIEDHIVGSDLFVVSITVSPAWEIDVTLDSDTRVSIDTCITLTRAVEEAFDREEQDYALTVGSAGIGSPLLFPRQRDKVLGKEVEVVGTDGQKWTATLVAHDEQGITVGYTIKEAVEGKKRKVEVEKTQTIPYSEIKTVCEALIV